MTIPSNSEVVTSQPEGIKYRPVEVISLKSCTRGEFLERFLRPGIPCIISDFGSDWPAYNKWSKTYFEEVLGETSVFYNEQNEEGPGINWGDGLRQTELSDFIARIDRGERIKHFGASHPLYDFVNTHPTLMGDVRMKSYERLVPKSRFFGMGRLDSRLWPWLPPYPPQMFIGGAGSFSPGHYDPDHSDTFHWCVWGRKTVKLFSYERRLAETMWSLGDVDFSEGGNSPEAGRHPELQGLEGWTAEITAGQTLFIPSMMWHFFKNEEVSMGFVVRSRSFNSLEGYCNFAADVQSPTRMIPFYASLWRKTDKDRRSFLGNLMAEHQRGVITCTRVILKLLRFAASLRRRASNIR